VTFAVEAEAYDRFVGRYGEALGRALAERAGVERGMSALDVGAGTGKLTGVLAEILGEENVAAVEPSEPFVAALRERFPAADVRPGRAEELPFENDAFDAALAQLVLNFMDEPERGVGEMIRVTRDGGVLAAAVWDYGQEMTLLTTFWESAAALDRRGVEARDERSRMRFRREGGVSELWRTAGIREAQGGQIVVSASYESFDDLWAPFTAGVGPPGAYASSLEPGAQAALREEYFRRVGSPEGPFELTARAWYAVGKK
jgi:SAM-dependent methyltransferase